jgi:hypothetical protein
VHGRSPGVTTQSGPDSPGIHPLPLLALVPLPAPDAYCTPIVWCAILPRLPRFAKSSSQLRHRIAASTSVESPSCSRRFPGSRCSAQCTIWRARNSLASKSQGLHHRYQS